jgi:signal transduction histidine kinase
MTETEAMKSDRAGEEQGDMTISSNNRNRKTAATIFSGGEMGKRMRVMDWTQTPLGPVEKWSQALRTSVSICLNSRFPMVIWWGRELVLLYNDGWRLMLGSNKDKIALGNRGEIVWAEVWDVLGPMFAQVLDSGEATWNDDGLLLVNRYGFTEEAYFTWSYSPILDDDGSVGGVFTAVTETTHRVIGERRLRTLRDLGGRSLNESSSVEEACGAAGRTLVENDYDFPFALIYLLDDDGKTARLSEAIRLTKGSEPAPVEIAIGTREDRWSLDRVLVSKKSLEIENLEQKFGRLTAGAWADAATKNALVLPLSKAGFQELPAGFLVCGLSPRLAFDEEYRSFLELAAGHTATAIADARTLEAERRRAEALAALDRAKTEFFSNVSHEFRTPLTLMLGNLEEVLSGAESLGPRQFEQIETAHRNSLRLLKLVNNLLDFSRLEAGKSARRLEPTDLSLLTADLASNFRAGVEKAGIRFLVDCPPLSGEIDIDREMWEKIVLNLLSNAFKFTLHGEIAVGLRETPDQIELTVRDTGVGIPAEALPKMFERFHRVPNTHGRTFE